MRLHTASSAFTESDQTSVNPNIYMLSLWQRIKIPQEVGREGIQGKDEGDHKHDVGSGFFFSSQASGWESRSWSSR